jgi:alcohol dehydrogenase class IV
MQFEFILNSQITFGKGSRFKINEILNKHGWKSICVIIDHGIAKLPIVIDLINSVLCNNIIIIECDISEPTYNKLEEKRLEIGNKDVDVFIGIGGGSALDMAKGLAVLHVNDGPAISYRGFDQFEEPIPTIIAIPTTAGTGSEITPNASFIDTKEKRKMGINGEAIRPKYGILDPELTLSCPKAPTVSAGVDSMVHATEAFVAKKSNPMAKMFAKKGFKLVFEKLPLLINKLDDIVLREEVMYGAFLSAVALMNSGTGPAAAMSYPLGVHYGVPHGIGGGVFLPHVVEHNINAGFIDYADLYQAVDYNIPKEKKARVFIEKVWKTWGELGIPRSLNEFGMDKSHISSFIIDTIDLKPALDQNPLPFYENEISKTLEKLVNS